MPFLKRFAKRDTPNRAGADIGTETSISNTKQRLIVEEYGQIAEQLHDLTWEWPAGHVARDWEIQRHFAHSVGLITNKKTAYRYFFCNDCRQTLVLNFGHQGRTVNRQLSLPVR